MQVIKNSWAGLGEQEGRQEVKIEWDIRENRPSNKKNKMKKAKRNDLQIYGYVLQLKCAYMCLNFFVLCLSYGVIIVPVMFSFCSCGSIWLLVPVCLFTVLVFMLSNVSLPILSLVFFSHFSSYVIVFLSMVHPLCYHALSFPRFYVLRRTSAWSLPSTMQAD